MPNWCVNELTIYGEKEKIEELVSKHTTMEGNVRTLDFDTILPYPRNADAWDQIQWCREFWGTKWNAEGLFFDGMEIKDYAKVFMRFLTAWTPPIPIIRQLAEKYPSLFFALKYNEDGMDIHGELTLCYAEANQ